MPTARATGLRVALLNLGDGQVIKDRPAEALIPPEPRVLPSPSAHCKNLELRDGFMRTRSGYSDAEPVQSGTTPILNIFNPIFPNGRSFIFVADDNSFKCSIDIDAAGGDFSNLAGTSEGSADNYWAAALGPVRSNNAYGNRKYFLSQKGVDSATAGLFVYNGGGSSARAFGADTPIHVSGIAFWPSGAHALVNFAGRLFAFNISEVTTIRNAAGTYEARVSDRFQSRVRWSVIGDSFDWVGNGSGFTDLDENNNYPFVNALVLSGRLIGFKGDWEGGGIEVGTPTGSVTAPVRWDSLNPRSGIGLLVPNSLIALSPTLAFFVGHDGFYLYDGARSLSPIGQAVTRHIFDRINHAHVHKGFAWYKRATQEIYLSLVLDSATEPNETWVFNVAERRVYGPYQYGDTLTAGAYVSGSGPQEIWQDAQSNFVFWSAAGGTYGNWSDLNPTRIASRVALGENAGDIYYDDGTDTTDDGTAISYQWDSPVILPEGRTLFIPDERGRTQRMVLSAEDALVLHDVTLRYQDNGAFTPTVAVSVDGGDTFTTLGAVSIGGDNNGQIENKVYTSDGITGTWFQFRITGTGSAAFHSLIAEFTPAGSERAH